MSGCVFIIQKLQVQELISLSWCQRLLPGSEKTQLSLVINQHTNRTAPAATCEGAVCSHPRLPTDNLQQHSWGRVLCTLDLEFRVVLTLPLQIQILERTPHHTHIGRRTTTHIHFEFLVSMETNASSPQIVWLFFLFCFLHRPAQSITAAEGL